MADAPLVTVLVNCFNHARWLDECLESVRTQTYPNVQLIVMDDCSTDGSPDLIRDWQRRTGADCTLVFNPDNRGLAATRNQVLARAKGTYVSWVSTDDLWEPDKLEIQVEFFKGLGGDVGVVYSDAKLIDVDGVDLPETFLEVFHPGESPPEGDLFARLARNNFIPSMATMVRRECLVEVGGYDERVPIEDWGLWVALARRTRFAFSPFVSARYRRVPGSRANTITLGDDLDSRLRIARRNRGHQREADRELRRGVEHSARALYEMDFPGYRRRLWEAVPMARSPALALTALLASARVPYRRALVAEAAVTRGVDRARAAIGARPVP